MRRADRLIKMTHFLRSRRRAVTAKRIAEEFEICTRTVYRDIQDLMDSGVPIAGEAGVGYMIDKEYYLPPIAFDADELEAISLGISMVKQWTDEVFAEKANNAFDKIQAILPAKLQGEVDQITTYSINMSSLPSAPWLVSFSDLRECIRQKHKINIQYKDKTEKLTIRTIRPLALFFFSPVWLLAGWCEKRQDFRHFRLDRITSFEQGDVFIDEPEKDFETYAHQEAKCYAFQLN